MMPKSDTITEIMKRNPSADPTFLSEFSANELDEYLGRLTSIDRASSGGSASPAERAERQTPFDQDGAEAGHGPGAY